MEVRVVYQPLKGSEPLYVAEERGIFARHGLRARYIKMFGGGKLFQALLAREVDLIVNAAFATPLYLAAEQGIYGKFVHPLNWTGQFRGKHYGPQSILAVRPDHPARALPDLRGKPIAVHSFGSTIQASLQELARRGGLDPRRDLVLTEVPFSRHEAVLRTGDVAAAVMVEPFFTVARKRGNARSLGGVIEVVFPDALISAVWTSEEYVKRSPEAVRRLQRAFAEAVDWINANEESDERYRILAKWTGQEAALLRELSLSVEYFKAYPDGFTDWQVLEEERNLLVKYGHLKRPVDVLRFDPRR